MGISPFQGLIEEKPAAACYQPRLEDGTVKGVLLRGMLRSRIIQRCVSEWGRVPCIHGQAGGRSVEERFGIAGSPGSAGLRRRRRHPDLWGCGSSDVNLSDGIAPTTRLQNRA